MLAENVFVYKSYVQWQRFYVVNQLLLYGCIMYKIVCLLFCNLHRCTCK